MLSSKMARNILIEARRHRDLAMRMALGFSHDDSAAIVYDGRPAVESLTKWIRRSRGDSEVKSLRDAFAAMLPHWDELAVSGCYSIEWESLDTAIDSFAIVNGLRILDDGTIVVDVPSTIEMLHELKEVRKLSWASIRKFMKEHRGDVRSPLAWRSFYCRHKPKPSSPPKKPRRK